MNIHAIYEGSNGDATRALYEHLQTLGPAGVIALNLFRAQKCSTRAKLYRGGNGRGSFPQPSVRAQRILAIPALCCANRARGNSRHRLGLERRPRPGVPLLGALCGAAQRSGELSCRHGPKEANASPETGTPPVTAPGASCSTLPRSLVHKSPYFRPSTQRRASFLAESRLMLATSRAASVPTYGLPTFGPNFPLPTFAGGKLVGSHRAFWTSVDAQWPGTCLMDICCDAISKAFASA